MTATRRRLVTLPAADFGPFAGRAGLNAAHQDQGPLSAPAVEAARQAPEELLAFGIPVIAEYDQMLVARLVAGLDGIRAGIDPGSPIEGDLGHLPPAAIAAGGIPLLPRTAAEALDAVEADPLMAAARGPVILPEGLKVKRSELAAYAVAVSDWEREAYLRSSRVPKCRVALTEWVAPRRTGSS